jgi:hypothetical protein
MPHGDRRNELSGAWVLRSEFERSSADARAVDGFIIPGQWRTKMTITKKIKIDKVEKAFQDLLSWSPQGVTATTKEATKLLAPLSDADLVVLHAHFGEHYTHWHQYAEPNLDGEPEDGELPNDDNGDAVMAVEEMHDAIKARWLISYVHSTRLAKAPRAKNSKLRVVK